MRCQTLCLYLTLACSYLYSFNVRCADATLSWSASPDADVAGYNIYFGNRSHTYTAHVNAGNVLTVTITNLEANTVYYFGATAFDSSGHESGYSNEAVYTTLSYLQPPDIQMTCTPQGENSPTVLQIQTRLGNYFDVEVSTNLVNWQIIATTSPATNVAIVPILDLTPWNDRKFYRVKIH